MISATAVRLGALRLQLTSKHGNKNFYKGTGSHPGLGLKRTGRFSGKYSKSPYILMKERMRTFVVPAGLDTTALRPYVERDLSRDPDPLSEKYTPERYGPNGLDGSYVLAWAEKLEEMKMESSTLK